MSNVIDMVLIGAGNRGRGIFGQYALDMPHRARFVAVVEPDAAKREAFAAAHHIPVDRQLKSVAEFAARARGLAEAAVIATLEDVRLEPVATALGAGYHLLIEKPLGTTLHDVIRLTDLAERSDRIVMVCHQMRYTPLYFAVRTLINSGRFGRIVSIQHSENLSFSHMAHSFVRGFFNHDSLTPMILAKACHDMDLLRWLVGKRPVKIASFGSLVHFRPEHAPAGAPARCLDGCPAEADCPFHVLKLYFGEDADPAFIRQMGIVRDKQELLECLKTNRFGRCVYHAGNNVVDNQVVQILFEDNVTASFVMCGHNAVERRMTKISLDRGEIELDVSQGIIHAHSFSPATHEVLTPTGGAGSHLGGDRRIMDGFVDAIRTGNKNNILTPVAMSLDSHLMAFAAEESRHKGQVVDLKEFETRARALGA